MTPMPGMGMTSGALGLKCYIPLVDIRKEMSPFPAATRTFILYSPEARIHRGNNIKKDGCIISYNTRYAARMIMSSCLDNDPARFEENNADIMKHATPSFARISGKTGWSGFLRI
jgi:hypothetical protein